MALKEEKAQSMFNKWWSMRRALHVRDPDEPPPVIEECNSLQECHRWRQTVMKDVGDKVAEIQNAGLGDFKIRALNDEINKLLNHKRLWEKRIRELGGPDLTKNEVRFSGSEGLELPGSGGYLYFGAAKDLPGVRELFYERPPAAPEKTRAQIEKGLDAEYFQPRLQPDDLQALEEFSRARRNEVWRKWAADNRSAVERQFSGSANWDSDELQSALRTQPIGGLDSQPASTSLPADYKRQLEDKRRQLLEAFFPSSPGPATEAQPGEPDYLFVEEFGEAINE